MKILSDIKQRTPEWLAVKKGVFSASELDSWCIDPLVISLNLKEISAELERLGIPHKKNDKREILEGLLPNPESYKKLTKGARTAILSNINETEEKDAWEIAIEEKKELQFQYNLDVQRGNALEGEARGWYEFETGHKVTEVGFIMHDELPLGLSPDGLIYLDNGDGGSPDWPEWGLEIKVPGRIKHREYLLDGVLPEDYRFQVHGSMAISGLKRWDFLSYYPGEKPLLITVHRDQFTESIAQGLIEVCRQKELMKARLAAFSE